MQVNPGSIVNNVRAVVVVLVRVPHVARADLMVIIS